MEVVLSSVHIWGPLDWSAIRSRTEDAGCSLGPPDAEGSCMLSLPPFGLLNWPRQLRLTARATPAGTGFELKMTGPFRIVAVSWAPPLSGVLVLLAMMALAFSLAAQRLGLPHLPPGERLLLWALLVTGAIGFVLSLPVLYGLHRVLSGIPREVAQAGVYWSAPASPSLAAFGAAFSPWLTAVQVPLWLLTFPVGWGLSLFALRVIQKIMGLVVVRSRDRFLARQARVAELWAERSAGLQGFHLLAVFSLLFFFFQFFTQLDFQIGARYQPGSLAPPKLLAVLERSYRSSGPLEFHRLLSSVPPGGELARILPRADDLLRSFSSSILLFVTLHFFAMRFGMSRLGLQPGSKVALGVESPGRRWAFGASFWTSVAVGGFLTLVALYMAALVLVVTATGRLPNGLPAQWLIHPVGVATELAGWCGRPTTGLDALRAAYLVPALGILADFAIVLGREAHMALKLKRNLGGERLRRLWTERLGSAEIPALFRPSPADSRRIRTPEARFLIFPPFRYIALPGWFEPPIIDETDAAALLAHEHYHLSFHWRRRVCARLLFLLTLRCPNAVFALGSPAEEFAADDHACDLLGGDGGIAMARALKRLERAGLSSRTPPERRARLSDRVVPAWDGFIRIWPDTQARIARLHARSA